MSQIDETNTTDYYDTNADQWADTHSQNLEGSYWEDEMETFQKYLPNGHILEIGSGSGKDAAALIARGYEYTGTDISKGLLQIARKNNPHATFFEKSVYNLDFDTKFDGFWTAATLLHIPKARISEALEQIHKNMKDEAIGFISLKMGEGEKVEETTQRFFAYYSLEEFSHILKKNNFDILDSNFKQSSGKTRWLTFWVVRLNPLG